MYRFKREFETTHPHGIVDDLRNQQLIVIEYINNKFQFFDKKEYHMISSLKLTKDSIDFNQSQYNQGLCLQPATNNIVVADDQCLKVFSNPDHVHLYTVKILEERRAPRIFNCPVGVSCNKQGHIIVSEWNNHQVHIIDEKGRLIRSMGTMGQHGSADDQFYNPWGICVDRNHNQIMIADSSNRRIKVWSGDGSQLIRSIHVDNRPLCITIDLYNRLIVGMDYDRMGIFDLQSFGFIQSFGGNGSDSGKFSGIYGMCVLDDNSLAICDYRNHRVQIFAEN
jgi:6-bladed beta-propeller/NHL repeat